MKTNFILNYIRFFTLFPSMQRYESYGRAASRLYVEFQNIFGTYSTFRHLDMCVRFNLSVVGVQYGLVLTIFVKERQRHFHPAPVIVAHHGPVPIVAFPARHYYSCSRIA